MNEVTANQHVQVLIPPDGGASGQATQRLDRRALQLDALRLELRGGREPISKTQTDGRAGVRPLPPQQRCHTVPPKRPQSSTHRVAINDDDPQPHQASSSPDRHCGGLKRPPPQSHRRSRRTRNQRSCYQRSLATADPTFGRQPHQDAAVEVFGRGHRGPAERARRHRHRHASDPGRLPGCQACPRLGPDSR
jgi:hypothetical protein